jgi:hypothetical protein
VYILNILFSLACVDRFSLTYQVGSLTSQWISTDFRDVSS